MSRQKTGYRVTTFRNATGDDHRAKECSTCQRSNRWTLRVCRGCGREFRKARRKSKPRRGTEDRLRLDLAHAGAMSDRWTTKVKAAVTALHYWNRRERDLSRRLAAGPQPKKVRVAKPKLRGIKLREEPQP